MNAYNIVISLHDKRKKKKLLLLCLNKALLHTSKLCRYRKSSSNISSFNNSSLLICNEKEKDGSRDNSILSDVKKKSDFIQYVFKWGIGNKFRSDPENRYHPVHLHRSKEVTIRKSYFESVNKNIKYEDLNEQWEVFWFENNKLNAKPFPVKKYGIETAKREAFKFYESLKAENRVNTKPQYESEVEGVHYDVVTNCWVSFYRLNNFPVCRSFSAEYHGFETAKRMAIDRVNKHKK
ncbi:transcription factor with AP2 domain(s), putative [Plasmodium ovale]|uniref:Transcription factor with AP2 domain(S), putative n=2 Tax=Plasmodium ovale TaxID=36330 RepID=A0A1D3THP3_PLAOA|nr:transcription factor with AP2 domain(s), putative (ApiAP2) [Plasmodium ovale curtisi]SBS90772.1 transcription factor with AP2 domain(s), putative (ApiAP2) [Plasmodium ovale curtisi]SCP04483.1 transcription factor with AP2 domain(s), putative [Plasmodium ovale]